MKQPITFSQFHDAFRDMDRLDNFSYEGLRVLFDWFESLDEDCGTDTELDVIAICCEFSESTPDEIRANYDIGTESDSMLIQYLNEHTMVCGETDTTIVYQDF